jgi:hypothetical protein
MATWIPYRGLEVPDVTTGDAGTKLKAGLQLLARGAPHASTADPTANDDLTNELVDVGSLWLNTASQTLWICIDKTDGAAKWRSVWRRTENAIVLSPVGAVTGTDNRAAIVGGESNTAFSIDSVVAGGKGNNAGGSSGSITNISIANPTVLTSTGHGLLTGQTIAISNSTSTNNINGNRAVTVINANTFSVSVNVSNQGNNSGSWTTSATAAYAIVAGGQNNKALGKWSHAEGFGTTAVGSGAHAEGAISSARGWYSHAEGHGNLASGFCGHAEGSDTTASGPYAHAEGYETLASGIQSHAEGSYSTSSGFHSHAEGWYSTASGYSAHAEGRQSTASAYGAHSEGSYTVASGLYAHAGGNRSKAHLRAQWARASGGHSSAHGTAQITITTLFRLTTNTSANELTLDGGSPSGSNRFKILDGQTLSCFVNVVGRREDNANNWVNDHGSFLRQVCIRREGSTTQLVGAVQTVGTDINPAAWGGVAITADDTNEALKIEVTGNTGAANNIRWTATVMASEVADTAI